MTSDARARVLEPITLGALELNNRIAMAPMTRARAHVDAIPPDSAPLYYVQRAGAGLIVSEGTCISPTAVGSPSLPGIWSEEQIAAWTRITAAVHDAGGRIVSQLWHMGRACVPSVLTDGRKAVAPSAIAIDGTTYDGGRHAAYAEPEELTAEQIAGIVRDYAQAAENARRAGFDGVELHGANGYLVDQFLHASSNRRTDAYGGDAQSRTRFLAEVTEAICNAWEPQRVGVRLSPTSTFQDMHDPDLAALYEAALTRLDAFDLAYVHVVEPGISGADSTRENAAGQLGSAWARERTRHALISTGGHTPERAAETLRRGDADVAGFARLFLANPDLPQRIAAGATLNEPVRESFYGGDDGGYLDYPSREAERVLAELRARVAADGEGALPDVEPLDAETPAEQWPLAWAAGRLRAELAETAAQPTA